jgi:hypothetical protein
LASARKLLLLAGVSKETNVYTQSSLRWRELAEGAEACEIESPS